MKKFILFIIITATFNCWAQTGAHTTTSRVTRIYMSKDETQFLSLSGTELVLWDNVTNKPIWIKKLADLGFGNQVLADGKTGAHPDLKYFIISNNTSYKALINLTTFQVTRWNCDNFEFLKDGRIPIMEYDFSKKNSHTGYLLNLDTGQKELIAENIGDFYPTSDKTKVTIRYHNKDSGYSDKIKIYDPVTKKIDKAPVEVTKYYQTPVEYRSGNYTIKYSFYDRNIKTYDASGKEIAAFSIQNLLITSGMTYMFYCSPDKPHAYFLEQESNNSERKNSHLYCYDITNGNVLKKVELHNTSDAAKNLAKQELAKHDAVMAEKERIFNLPQNVEKRRLANFYGLYLYNFNTKGIYYVVPDMPLYEGDLVKMKAMHDDKKQIQEVYEKLTAIENPSFYKTVSSPKTCNACGGKGFFESSGQRTVADYEYTTGKKLVETTYNKSGCSNCGGCGLIPN